MSRRFASSDRLHQYLIAGFVCRMEDRIAPAARTPKAWMIWVFPLGIAAAFGVFGGLGLFTFGYGEGYAYLGNDPRSCANCHVMQESYDSWLNSSHHAVAVCNDCHTPHDNLLAKYATKADNGFFHSLAFTTGDFKDPIQIKKRNSDVVQAACLDCHDELVNHMLPLHAGGEMLACVHCHASVGHAQTIAPRRN